MQESRTNARDRERPGAMEELARDPGSRKRFLRMVGGAGSGGRLCGLLGGLQRRRRGRWEQLEPRCCEPGWRRFQPGQGGDPKEGTSDVEILNYALSLENLETSLYGKVVESGLFRGSRLDLIKKFADNERQHRELLEATVEKLDGKPAAPQKTSFPLNSASGVLTLAATIENGGAAAYLGQANRIRDKEVLAAALSIHTVEARHAAVLNELVGLPPTPQGSFAGPLSMEGVLTSVQRYIDS